MAVLSVTKGTRQRGLQTYANVQRLLPELRDAELQYLDVRDWYINEVARKAQYDEALAQAKAAGDAGAIKEFANKVHGIQCNLEEARQRVKAAGEMSYAAAFLFVARKMLGNNARRAVEEATERMLGRGPQELARNDSSRRSMVASLGKRR